MLDTLRAGRRRILHSALFLATAALGVSASSCSIFYGEHDVTVHFLAKPGGSGSFTGWSEISIDQDVSGVNKATLLAVTLSVEKPDSVTDLTFISSLEGSVTGSDGQPMRIVSLDEFPRGEAAVSMNVLYSGDLKPLFKDPHTIRINWKGTANPAFTNWPPDGIWVNSSIKIDVE
jgi:hypothetical protein